MERTSQTAQILADVLGCDQIIKTDELSDTYLPSLEGRPLSILRTKGFKNEYDEEIRTPDSETAQDVIERTNRFLLEIKQKHPGENVAIVSHGDPIRFMLWMFQYPEKEPDTTNLRDEDYPEPAEAIALYFGEQGQFLGFEYVRREKESLAELDSRKGLKEA